MNFRSWAQCIISFQAMFFNMLVASSTTHAAMNSTNRVQGGQDLAEVETSPSGCWVFTHMNKSGGMTIRRMLLPWLEAKGVTIELFDDIEWSSGQSFAEDLVKKNAGLTYGGYTEGLRMYDARDCQWFTIFRHPVSRVVSAYFYCQRKPRDQLCATVVKDATKADLVTFAEHWGNYGLRQFALAFIKSEDVFHDAIVDDFCKHERGHGDICLPSWYRQKTYLNALSDQDGVCGAAQPESGLAQFLSRAQETLSNRYAAVGILEEWDDTMKLFNEVLSLQGFDWVKQFQQSGTKNSSSGKQFETAEQRALETAWHSAELKRFIWLDIILYDHALTVHRKQVVDNGIGLDDR